MAGIHQNKGIGWQTLEILRIESQGIFGRLANLRTGDPPENRTAASTGIEGGGKAKWIGGDRSGEEHYYTDRLTSIAPRIIATHYGVDR